MEKCPHCGNEPAHACEDQSMPYNAVAGSRSKACYMRQLAQRTKERDEALRALNGLPDCEERGWGNTLKENILCHLRTLCDLDGKHWELNPKADAGHERPVALIVMRLIGRMLDSDDKLERIRVAAGNCSCRLHACPPLFMAHDLMDALDAEFGKDGW